MLPMSEASWRRREGHPVRSASATEEYIRGRAVAHAPGPAATRHAAEARPNGEQPAGLRGLARHLPIAILAGWYVVHFSELSIASNRRYGTSGYDLGLFDQGLWLLSRLKAPFVTIMGRNLFGDHASFVLLPLVPIYRLWPNPDLLLCVQSLALGLSVIPAYLLGRERLPGTVMPTVLAASLLLHPALAWGNLEQFHPDSFLVPLTALVIFLAASRRWRPGWLMLTCAMALLVKEDALLVIVPIGLYVALRRDRRLGLKIVAGACAYGLVATEVVMRAMTGMPSLNGWRIPFGGPIGLLRTAVGRPSRVLRYLLSGHRPSYVWQMLVPTAGVFLWSPEVAAVGALALGSNVLSTFVLQHNLQYHYSLVLVPVLAMGTVSAIGRLRPGRPQQVAVAAVAGCTFLACVLWGAFPFSVHQPPRWGLDGAQARAVDTAARQLPPNAVVSAYFTFVPHVDHRERIYQFPTPFKAFHWGTYRQEGQQLSFVNQIQYLFLPVDLAGSQGEVFDSIATQFRLIHRVGNAAVYQRVALTPIGPAPTSPSPPPDWNSLLG